MCCFVGFSESKGGRSLSYFICDLAAEFGVDNIRRVHDRGVLEVAWLLSVLFLVKEENTKNQHSFKKTIII